MKIIYVNDVHLIYTCTDYPTIVLNGVLVVPTYEFGISMQFVITEFYICEFTCVMSAHGQVISIHPPW
jgi:hypothetical protein